MIKKLFNNNVKYSFEETFNKAEVPIISVKISNKTYNFIIDTGSDSSYINSKDLDDISEYDKQVIGHQDAIIGGTGVNDGKFLIYNIKFECQGHEFTEEFTENEFSEVFDECEEICNIRLNGILGSKFLAKHKCILDFGDKIFYL